MKPHTGPKAIPKIITGRQDAGVTEPPIGISKSLTCDRMKLSARHTPPDVILRIFSLLLDIYTSIQNSVCRRIQTEEKTISNYPYAGIIRQVQRVGLKPSQPLYAAPRISVCRP